MRRELAASLRPEVLVAVAALAAACGPKSRPAFDAAAAPKGTGWFCYQHEQPGTVSAGICYREREGCAARATSDGNVPCNGVERAYCMDLHPDGPHDVQCFATAEDCEKVVAEQGPPATPSQCAELQ